jgi:hypothetical protein
VQQLVLPEAASVGWPSRAVQFGQPERRYKVTTEVINKLRNLLEELEEENNDLPVPTIGVAVPGAPGTKTFARKDYAGGNPAQDLMDVARRFLRYSKAGKQASKAERNLAKRVMKDFKKLYVIWNTNGVDVWTINGL